MTTEQRTQQIQDDFIDFAAEYPRTALSMITGLLVGLLEHQVEQGGGDSVRRDVTISAKPESKPSPLGD